MKTLILAAFAAAPLWAAPGYYTVAQSPDGRWDLMDPAGKVFYCQAVNNVHPADSSCKPGAPCYNVLARHKDDKAAWAKATIARLRSWGFNSLGAWCDDAIYGQGMPYTVTLYLEGYGEDRLMGVFEPGYAAKLAQAAVERTVKWKADKDLIGYFLDNELPWFGNTGWPGPQNTPLLDRHLKLAPGTPGHQAALKAFLRAFPKASKADLRDPAAALAARDRSPEVRQAREDFVGLVAERYFSAAGAAVRSVDPKHLVLGARFAGAAPRSVIAASGRHCDVVSMNHYSKSGNFDTVLFDTVYALTKKPVMLTEFSYRAMQNRSGDKNTRGADVTVATQQDRSQYAQRFLATAGQLKYLVGYHWFQYFDESPEGRSFDGEDSNYGLVDIHDQPYEELLAGLKLINRDALARHQTSARPLPDKAPEPKRVRLRTAVGAQNTLQAPQRWGDYGGADAAKAMLWKEPSASATQRSEGGKLTLDFDTGNEWGLGLAFAPGKMSYPDGSADMLGASKVVYRLQLPKGIKFTAFLTESGVAEPGASAYNGAAGADGESFSAASFEGTGRMQDYVVDLSQLEARSEWGNQNGEKIVDLQAVRTLDLAIAGKQGRGRMVFEELEVRP